MKNIKLSKQVFVILLIFLNLSVHASISKYSISGKFINFQNGDLADLTITATKVTPSGQISENIQISDDGEFTINGKSFKKLDQIWLSIGDIYYGEILISTELNITLDFNKLSKSNVTFYGKGIAFEGSDSEVTTLANKWTKFGREEKLKLQSHIQSVRHLSLSESKKIDSLKTLFNRLEQLESMFLKEYPKSSAWILKDKRKSEYYNNLFLLLNKKNINWKNINEALAFTPNLFGNSSWLFYRYQSLVLGESYIGSNVFKNWEDQEKNLNRINSHNRDFLIISAIPENLEWQEKYLNKFLPYVSHKWAKEYVEDALVSTNRKIREINIELEKTENISAKSSLGKSNKQYSFGAETFISEEEDVFSFIKKIQKKFKGKAIIIDLWATWCAPCITDMKESKPIKQQIENLPIEIIYVCTEQGSKVENWEKKIAEIKTKGTHIFINKKLTASFMEKFELSGYPSFLFFNSNGVYKKNVVQRISDLDVEKLKERILQQD